MAGFLREGLELGSVARVELGADGAPIRHGISGQLYGCNLGQEASHARTNTASPEGVQAPNADGMGNFPIAARLSDCRSGSLFGTPEFECGQAVQNGDGMVLIALARLHQESNQVRGEHWTFRRDQDVHRICRKAMGCVGHVVEYAQTLWAWFPSLR